MTQRWSSGFIVAAASFKSPPPPLHPPPPILTHLQARLAVNAKNAPDLKLN